MYFEQKEIFQKLMSINYQNYPTACIFKCRYFHKVNNIGEQKTQIKKNLFNLKEKEKNKIG
jgi:hypothetical protein